MNELLDQTMNELDQLRAAVTRIARELREQGQRGLGDYYADADAHFMIDTADELLAALGKDGDA